MSKETEAPPAAASHHNQLIEADPYLVAFSLNNPRKRRGLDVESLSALASSIKAQGLAQPILVRPLPGTRAADTFADRQDGQPLPTYELVCGERRLRASRLAELATIPMIVRSDLDDDAALELQLVENIEREDLDPMEEAEGFELLRNKLGYSIEQIAERIGKGKGKSYVYKAMKLLELTPESREAMFDGHLGRSTGLLVARYPAAQQAQVVQYIKGQANGNEPAPYRVVAPLVFRRFNLGLNTAVWAIADAHLVPAAGACTACPKRTGAHGDLFGDDDNSPDSCTDPDCFEAKRAAHIEQVKAKAAKDGFKVIDGEEAKAAVISPHSNYLDGYSRLTDIAYTEEGDDGKVRQVTFEDALRAKGKKAPKPRVLIHPFTGEAIKVITADLADKLVPEEDRPTVGKARGREAVVDDRPEDQRALDDYDTRRAVMLRVFDAIRNRDRTDGDMLLIAKALFGTMYNAGDELDATERYLNWDLVDTPYGEEVGVIHAKLDALPAAEVAMAITVAAVEIALSFGGINREQQLALIASYGVDVLAVRDKVAEDLERQEAAEEDEDAAVAEEEQPADAASAAGADDQAEPHPSVGARVRMKDNLGTAGGKRRKISGREGVLLKELVGGDWMFKSDGGKDQARVARDEFIVLPAQAGETESSEGEGDGAVDTAPWPLPKKTPAIDPAAAWPFPVER